MHDKLVLRSTCPKAVVVGLLKSTALGKIQSAPEKSLLRKSYQWILDFVLERSCAVLASQWACMYVSNGKSGFSSVVHIKENGRREAFVMFLEGRRGNKPAFPTSEKTGILGQLSHWSNHQSIGPTCLSCANGAKGFAKLLQIFRSLLLVEQTLSFLHRLCRHIWCDRCSGCCCCS